MYFIYFGIAVVAAAGVLALYIRRTRSPRCPKCESKNTFTNTMTYCHDCGHIEDCRPKQAGKSPKK